MTTGRGGEDPDNRRVRKDTDGESTVKGPGGDIGKVEKKGTTRVNSEPSTEVLMGKSGPERTKSLYTQLDGHSR